MCSELFRIPYHWGNVPIFGFGVLLAVWAVVGLGSLAVTVRRHGWNPEMRGLLPLVLIAGAAIVGLPKIFPDGLPIRGYGLMVLLGAAAGVALATRRARGAGLDPESIWSMAVWLLVGGIIGARVFYVIEYWGDRFRSDSVLETIARILDFPEGGLVIYGGFLGAALAVLVFVRKHRLPALATFDLIAPSLAIGLAFGRIGCLLNGCCYGGPAAVPWAVTFPPTSPPYMDQIAHGDMYGFHLVGQHDMPPIVGSVRADSPAAKAGLTAGDIIAQINISQPVTVGEAETALLEAFAARQPVKLGLASGRSVELPAVDPPARSLPVHPTQIYAAISAGLLGWFLWAYYPLRRRDGEVFALLVTIYPVSRFLEEMIRTDEPAVFGTGMHISQNISLALLVGVVGLWIYLAAAPPGLTAAIFALS